jgi:hypothetical protein
MRQLILTPGPAKVRFKKWPVGPFCTLRNRKFQTTSLSGIVAAFVSGNADDRLTVTGESQ